MNTECSCGVCGAGYLAEIDEFRVLGRVTSDCKPFRDGGRLFVCTVCGTVQKGRDSGWIAEIDQIYREYKIYSQSGGVEQGVFSPTGEALGTRSSALVRNLLQEISVGDTMSVLDVGCGNGAFLRAMDAKFGAAELFGFELSDRDLASLCEIGKFRWLYSGSLEAIDRQFSIVSLIHALEHFPSPIETVRTVSSLMSPEGSVFVQVPNALANPYDLLIADHAYHFTPITLNLTLSAGGLGVRGIWDDWVVKELSALASEKVVADGAMDIADGYPEAEFNRVSSFVQWLSATVQRAGDVVGARPGIGLFGSSISAMWLYGMLGNDVAFFVDEDLSRQGFHIDGRPILHPDEVAEESIVFMPLLPIVARSVKARLSHRSVEWICPPNLPV